MNHVLKTIGILIIVIGLYTGVRYIGALIHYGCNEPEADGPPPLCLMGELGWVITGGDFVPLWTQD